MLKWMIEKIRTEEIRVRAGMANVSEKIEKRGRDC